MVPIFVPSGTRRQRVFAAAVALAALSVSCLIVRGQDQLSEPVYRVAIEAPAAQPAATTAATPVAATAPAPFDLTLQPGEHKLAPVIRVCKASLDQIDQNVRDYSCTLVKRERVDGELGEYQHIFMKVDHQPFSVYMSFLQPFAGREVLYVAGQNNNDIVVLEAGFKRMLGKLNLDPEGMVAMRGQKYPITKVGIRYLTSELLKVCETETQFAECDVTTNLGTKINGRPTTMVQILHPIPRQNFRAHVSRVFFDNELRIPIHYDAFLWPDQPGGEPPLEESYTYTNLKINNDYTASDFDSNNNPEIFKQ